jgi:hypothetical protein
LITRKKNMVKSPPHNASRYVVFPTPVTPSRLGPHIFLSTLFSNTLSLWRSFNIRDEASHPYKTRDRTTTQHTLTVYTIYLDRKLADTRIYTECRRAFPAFNLLSFS